MQFTITQIRRHGLTCYRARLQIGAQVATAVFMSEAGARAWVQTKLNQLAA